MMSHFISANKFLAGVLLIFSSLSFADSADGPWERIVVSSQKYTVEVDGADREIYPGCALPGDDYSFYFKEGKSDKLVIYFNGGGACWDFNTCIASLQTPAPTYVPSDDLPHNMPQIQQGIFDLDNEDNPYRDWSMLYLPYCTGDVSVGSIDQSYQPSSDVPPMVIRHRGFDNFLFARAWVKNRYGENEGPAKVLVAGSSAGGYAAALNYPYIRDVFPNAKGYLIADGSSGVLTDNFMAAVFNSPDSVWGVNENIADWLPGLMAATTLNGSNFSPAVYAALSEYYPKDRFSQYSTVWDAVQVMFYHIMLDTGQGMQWPPYIPEELFAQWTAAMQTTAYMGATASNYRFYIASGCQHTVLRAGNLYSSTPVSGVTTLDWMSALTQGRESENWDNLSCTGEGCLVPPTAEQVMGCLVVPSI